jgi:eukaryotic-like serine/threonine-protein kinase
MGAAAALIAGVLGLSAVAIVQARANGDLLRANSATTHAKNIAEQALQDVRKAKLAADNALAQSEESRNRAEAVLGFLKNDVLAATRPEGQMGGLGYDVSVRKALDSAEPKITTEFRDQLVAEADIPYDAAGRAAEAVPIFEVTLRQLELKIGADHPNALSARNNLAAAYLAAGRASDAVTILEQTLALRTAKLGPNHPLTLQSLNNLAVACELAARPVEALRMKEEVLRLRESKLSPDHPDALLSRSNLATLYEALGRWPQAEALRREGLARRRKIEPAESPLLAVELVGLGRNLFHQERFSEAEPLFRELIAVRTRASPSAWQRYEAISLLGGSLLGQGRYADAEPLLRAGYEGMKARDAKMSTESKPRLGEAAVRLITLYDRWAKPDQARDWKRRLALVDLPADVFAGPGLP